MKIRLVAKTPYERAKGLMYSKPLNDNEVAIFIFSKDTRAGFWNVNVNYPIKVIFFDKDLNIVNILRLEKNQTEQVKPENFYRYAAEVADKPLSYDKIDYIRNYIKSNSEDKL